MNVKHIPYIEVEEEFHGANLCSYEGKMKFSFSFEFWAKNILFNFKFEFWLEPKFFSNLEPFKMHTQITTFNEKPSYILPHLTCPLIKSSNEVCHSQANIMFPHHPTLGFWITCCVFDFDQAYHSNHEGPQYDPHINGINMMSIIHWRIFSRCT